MYCMYVLVCIWMDVYNTYIYIVYRQCVSKYIHTHVYTCIDIYVHVRAMEVPEAM